MVEMIDESQSLESTTVGIFRTAAVVKGGRRFSFGALVVIGNRGGRVGIGYGKAPGVPSAIEKAQKDARKRVVSVPLTGGTLPHPVTGIFGSSQVRLLPAAPGTGVIASGTVRAVLELAGVQDCLTKAYGSTNKKNLCKAVIQGLTSLRTKEQVAALRNVKIELTEVEKKIAAGQRYAPKLDPNAVKAAAPKSTVGPKRGKGRKPSRSRRPKADAPPAAAPAPEAAAPPGGTEGQTTLESTKS